MLCDRGGAVVESRKRGVIMTESEAIARIRDHFEVHNDGRPHPRLDEAVEMAIKALEEVQQYRQIGTVEECREAVEKQKKGLSVDEAKRIAAKAICIGCGYLTGYECSYNGRNCMISKPMLESVSKSFDDWNRRANDGKID